MTKYKVGEKIVFYDCGVRLIGHIAKMHGNVFIIQIRYKTGAKIGDINWSHHVHAKQCRKIKK